MLAILRRIVQDVNAAGDLDETLRLIVTQVKEAMNVDVCSIYLNLPDTEELTLMASDGLNPNAIGRVSLCFDEGLVGLVAQRAEPINVSHATSHKRYKYFPETGEEQFSSFLAVPVLHRRRTMGVLVTQQQEEREFDEDHVAFLVTLAAQLAGAINHAEISGELNRPINHLLRKDLFVNGIAGAPGVGIGTAVVMFPTTELSSVPDRETDNPEAEIELFEKATSQVQRDVLDIKERMVGLLQDEDRLLFDAYVMMLNSTSLRDGTIGRIRMGNWAPGALRATIQEHARNFDSMEDAYLRERATDVREIGRRLLEQLLSVTPRRVDFPENTVLVGRDLSATQMAEIPSDRLAGLICTTGTNSSHVAILARALDVPTVMGATDFPVSRIDGKEVIVDGYQGRVYLQPSVAIRKEFQRLAREEEELSQDLMEDAAKPATTPDGERIPIYINSGLMAELVPSQAVMTDGIGLYRTEVPFMVRERFPGEAEQTKIYQQVLSAFPRDPVVLRTLDVGGDKALSYFPIEEDNPFLGYRGIRISLDHPEIFLTQLRAMLKANRNTGNLHILYPMIGSTEELDEALALTHRAYEELKEEDPDIPMPRTGVMIEVPSAVYLAEQLAHKVDFLSVGTNDLIQYLLAVDRNNARVADLYDENHPAVLAALEMTVKGAKRAGKTVSICGEMASDPASALLLLGCGIDSLSVSLASLPRIKWVVRSFTRSAARELFQSAMQMQSSTAIRAMVEDELTRAGLGALVRAGKH